MITKRKKNYNCIAVIVLLLQVSCSSRYFSLNPPNIPSGAFSLTYDIGNNFWCLAPCDTGNELMVLPAGNVYWQIESLSNIGKGNWHTVLADKQGVLWLAGENSFLFLNTRQPRKGWVDCKVNPRFPKGRILTVVAGEDSNIIAIFDDGTVAKVILRHFDGNHIEYSINILGRCFLKEELKFISSNKEKRREFRNEKLIRKFLSGKNEGKSWELVSTMPGSNHDLRGGVFKGNFYMAGGLTAEYGYPLSNYAYSSVFKFITNH